MNAPNAYARLRLALTLVVVAGGFAIKGSAQRMEVTARGVAPVVVETADVSAELTGRLAVTTFDLVFRNPNDRPLEGAFVFPLSEGQQVIHFALDVNGTLREAVPVEKNKGRALFEDIDRRADSGTPAEPVAGNAYRIRVYPIPAYGTRRVRLSYQQDLVSTSADQGPNYRVALNFPATLKHFHLLVIAHTGASAPALATTTLDLQLPPWRDGQRLELERSDFDARGTLDLALPKAEHPSILTGRFDGREYFSADVPNTPILSTRPVPKTLGLVWDSSASGRDRNHDKEFALLDAWFADMQNLDVRLVRLRNRATREGTFGVRNGNWAQLRKELEDTVYDGATSLDGLQDDPAVDAWVIFSDGLFNYGTTHAGTPLPLHGTIHTVLASARADAGWLRALADQRNGEFVNALELEPSKAAFALEANSMRIVALEFNPEEVSSVFPAVGTAVPRDSFAVTGILRKKQASLRILVGHSREDAQSTELTLISGDNPSFLAPRSWAVAKIEQLAARDAEANRAEIEATAKSFGIAMPDTALVVLESAQDFLRFDLTPPDDLRAQWEALRSERERTNEAEKQEHLENVVHAFEHRQAWWNETYPLGPLKKSGATSPSAAAPGQGAPTEDVVTLSTAQGGGGDAARASATSPTPNGAASFGSEAKVDNELSGAAPGEALVAPSVALQRWSPDSEYVERLRHLKADRRYAAYVEQRADHLQDPGFFLDVADLFFDDGDNDTALRVLSNLAELQTDDPALMRVLGYRLIQANRSDLAVPLLQRVLRLRPEEPQSRRDLALALASLGEAQRAVDLLAEIVNQTWDTRFPEIELIALSELNAIAATCGKPLDLSKIDPRLRKNLPLDLRVVLTWDASDSDMDLWVTDPNAQTAKYDFPITYQGGRMSRDFTGGYGPEEFDLHRAKIGRYLIKINYYGDRRQEPLGPITAQVRVITGFGTAQQQEKRIFVRLKEKQDTIDLGEIEMPPAKSHER